MLSALKYGGGILLKSFCYLHEVGHTTFSADFWSFHNFRSQCGERSCCATWRRKWAVTCPSERAMHQYRPINHDTILVQSMFPSNEQCTRRPTAWQTNIQTPYFRTYSIVLSPKLCRTVEDVETILKGGNHFQSDAVFFIQGRKCWFSAFE